MLLNLILNQAAGYGFSMTKLKAIPSGLKLRINDTCSPSQKDFYDKLLASIQHTKNAITRLLSLPGMTNLLECDSYLHRYFKHSTGLSSKICPHTYHSSLDECKTWALSHCRAISLHERLFLDPKIRNSRSKRSWMCHAGLFGLFRTIYESTGRLCEPNHVENLESTLKDITSPIDYSQSLIRNLHGKLVYIVKTTDSLATKVNHISRDIKLIDNTFCDWEAKMNNFAKEEQCNFRLSLEFSSKHTNAVNRAFASLLRLIEIQNTLHQFHKLANKTLFSSSELPEFLSEIRKTMNSDSKLYFTAKAFSKGFSVMVNPMIDIEHTGTQYDASILFTIPEISNLNSFCTLEYLYPLKFNFSNVCYEGPITKTDLVLITCPKSRQLTTVQVLKNVIRILARSYVPNICYKLLQILVYLASHSILTLKSHSLVITCGLSTVPKSNLWCILAGDTFLSTTMMLLGLSSGTIMTSPFMVYHVPCNATFAGITTGLGCCTASLSITVPVFLGVK